MFSVIERVPVIVSPRFMIMLRHSNVGPCATRRCCDRSLIYNVTIETLSVERAKLFISAIHCIFWVGNLIAAVEDFLDAVLYYVRHTSCAAVADLEIISVEYLVESWDFGKCLSIKCKNDFPTFV